MGFSEDDALKLKPVNAADWDGTLDPRLTAPTGISDWEARSTALFFAENAQEEVTDGDGWELLEACGLVPYKSAKRKQKAKAEHSAVIKYPVPGQ
jgi:hypothetical protein